MKDRQTKERFIALRGHGLPLANIAAEIAVSKTTLINWDPGLKEEIDNLGALQPEAVNNNSTFRRASGSNFSGVHSAGFSGIETRDLSEPPTEKRILARSYASRRCAAIAVANAGRTDR
jgi:hypothetical protein